MFSCLFRRYLLRLSIVLAVALKGGASTALAEDILSPLYGNTLIANDGGIESHFWYKADHTFTGTVPAYSYPLKGTWIVNADGVVCRNFNPPLPLVKNPDCGAILIHKLGDKRTDGHGHTEILVAGVQ